MLISLSYTTSLLGLLAMTAATLSVYRLFFHPLAEVPGPHFAALTRLWLAYHHRKGHPHRVAQALHKKYGPVVRISPNEVSLCSEEALRTIYSRFHTAGYDLYSIPLALTRKMSVGAGSVYFKSPWYRVAQAFGTTAESVERLDLFTEMNKDQYRLQRRLIGPAYSTAGLEKHEARLNECISKFLAKLRTFHAKFVNLEDWIHMFVLDTLSELTLSKSLNYIDAGNDNGNMVESEKMWRFFSVVGLFPTLVDVTQAFFPPVLTFLVCYLFGLRVPWGMPIFPWAALAILERLSAIESTTSMEPPKPRPSMDSSAPHDLPSDFVDGTPSNADQHQDILADLVNLHTSRPDFHPTWVLRMALTNFGGGHDTITVSLMGIILSICQKPSCAARIRSEIASAKASGALSNPPKYSEAIQLPYLMACIKEAMRLFPAVGNTLPRTVPAGGVTLSGHFFPAGTTVGINPYVLHASPALFGPDAEDFNPERWSRGDGARIERNLLTFGGASRSCPGQHLAMFVMVKMLVRLFSEFDVQLWLDGKVDSVSYFVTHIEGVRARFVDPEEGK